MPRPVSLAVAAAVESWAESWAPLDDRSVAVGGNAVVAVYECAATGAALEVTLHTGDHTWPRADQAIDAGFYFEGRGRGHGVGLCQEGCHDYATQGWDAERILAYDYSGARVVHLDEHVGL